MAAQGLPQEVTEHLEAAMWLSNRSVHLRFLDEAESLIALNLPAAAVLVAGVVLESIFAGATEQGIPEDRRQIDKWFDLRNGAAHHGVPSITVDQAKEMVEGVRRSLIRNVKVSPHLVPARIPAEDRERLRGKYKFVPTSSAEFIRRKGDELSLEHDEQRF